MILILELPLGGPILKGNTGKIGHDLKRGRNL